MSAQDNARMVRSTYDAYNDRAFDRAAALASEGSEWLSVPLGVALRGPEGNRQFLQGWATAFPDSRVEVTHTVADEEGVVVEFRGWGTHTGPLASPAGEIPATGRSIDIPFCQVFRLKGGKIVSSHLYFDAATMMGQLGLMPAQ